MQPLVPRQRRLHPNPYFDTVDECLEHCTDLASWGELNQCDSAQIVEARCLGG